MKAIKYRIKCCIDIPHNWIVEIDEIWIPLDDTNKEKGICVNTENGIFYEDKPRINETTITKEIDFDLRDAVKLNNYLENKEQAETLLKGFFGGK